MAVKLILVVLLVAVVASGLAQQSSDRQRTGGEDNTRTDRRLNALRRFRSRNRSNKETENQEKESGRGSVPRSRLADQDKIAERRRELLQRNGVSRRRKVVRNEVNEIPEEQTKKPVQNIRIRTTTEQSREIEEIPVERITNNNQEIIYRADCENQLQEDHGRSRGGLRPHPDPQEEVPAQQEHCEEGAARQEARHPGARHQADRDHYQGAPPLPGL